MASRLDVDAESAGLTPKELAKRSSGLGVVVEHDTRDNIFTPNRGWIGAAEATFYDRAIGSSNDFQAYRAHTFAYWPVMDTLTVGMRADYRAARGEFPFYFLPFIDLRGIPAARYQDNNAAVLETEVALQLHAALGRDRLHRRGTRVGAQRGLQRRRAAPSARASACATWSRAGSDSTQASTTRRAPRTTCSTSRWAARGAESRGALVREAARNNRGDARDCASRLR